MPYINLLIKPASSLCNMRCHYCFYADEAANRELPSMGIMSGTTAELLVSRALEEAGTQGGIGFAFQGGEPTMAGKEYFRNFIEIVKRLNKNKVPVNYGIQTNGLAIDAEWAAFLRRTISLLGCPWTEIKRFMMNFAWTRPVKEHGCAYRRTFGFCNR